MIDYKKYINALRKCAKEHENDRTSTGHIIISDLCRDTANLLEELEQEPKWIPVSERLPETAGSYLVTYKYPIGLRLMASNVWECYYIADDWICCDDNEVLAWMPKPEPYKENKE